MPPTPAREILSEATAHACLALVKAQFRAYLDAQCGYVPFVRLREDGRPHPFWEIVWENGSPHEWAHLAVSGGVDEGMAALMAEFGRHEEPMPPIAWPAGVRAEVGDYSFIVALYPDN